MRRAERRAGRRVGTRDPRERILIVCEGEKTEPLYFRAFPVTSAAVKTVGVGANTRTVVEEAIRLRDEDPDAFDQVWCVFDRDSFPKQRMNEAVSECARQGFGAAWSNEAFELWYLLHFDYCDAALSRATYQSRLSAKLGTPYAKGRRDLYDTLLPRLDMALRHAEKLEELNGHLLPADANPMTTVHALVALLRKHSRP